jgi:glycosyltransferase involved in cell wall biosynthesis
MNTHPTTRVVHVLRKLDASAWGGTEAHVAAMARHLRDHDVTSEVHAPLGPTQAGMPSGVPVRRFHTLVPFLGSEHKRRALVANAGNLVTLDELVHLSRDRTVHLAHLHTAGRIGGAVRTAMRLTGRRYVLSVHGPLLASPAYLEADTRSRLEGMIDLGGPLGALLGSRSVVDDAARVISFNDAEHRALQARIGPRAVRMDHGVDRERLAAGSSDAAYARWPELGQAPVVLVVGRLSLQKNQKLAVAAFAKGAPPDARLVLAGAETDPGYRAVIEAEARALGVADRVHILGNVAPVHVPDLLARASLVLVTSQHEAFGICVLEGWAAHRPVLFANRAGLADLAARLAGPTMAIDAYDDVDAWGAAMAQLFLRPTLAATAAAEGSGLVLRSFAWERAAAKLADLYRDVLEETRRAKAA